MKVEQIYTGCLAQELIILYQKMRRPLLIRSEKSLLIWIV